MRLPRALVCLGGAVLACLAPAQKITLRFTVWDGDISLKVLRKLCVQFEQLHPNIQVKLEPYPDYNVYHQKMLVLYAAKVAPDVAMMDMGHFNALSKRKAILPLNPFIEKTPGFKLSDYYEPIVKAHTFDGKLYVLPRDIAPEGLIYFNKRLFDEAHIPYPDGTWTWDFKVRPELKEKDFVWVCQQLTKKNKQGKFDQWGFSSGWPDLFARTLALSSGARYADDLEHPKKIRMGEKKMIDAYQFASDFMNKLKFMPNSTETSSDLQLSTQQLFANQKIAMYQNGIWEVPQMRDMIKPGKKGFFEWDIALFPAYKDGTRAAPTGGSGYSIFSSTPHPDEAWELVQFMSGPVAMTAMAKAGVAQPAIRTVAMTKGVWLVGPNTPLAERYPPSKEVTDQAVPYVIFDPIADCWPSVNERLSAGLDLLWNGQATAKEVLTKSAANGQTRLDTMLKEEKLSDFNWPAGISVGLAIIAGILLWVYMPEMKKPYSLKQRKESRSAYLFIMPWIIGMAIFTLGPMILSLLMSFTDWDVIQPAKWRGVGNYREAFTVDPLFWKSLRVTFIYTLISVPIGLIGSVLLALLLNMKVRGVALFRAVYYLPSLASLVAASLIWRKLFNPDSGLVNAILYSPLFHKIGHWVSAVAGTPDKQVDWLGTQATALPGMIIMSLWGIGGGMVILLAGLQGIPQHYYEAATLDGAGTMGKFKNVTLPLLTPTLFFSLVTGLIGSFQVFTQAFVMTQGGPNDTTRFFVYHMFGAAFQSMRMGYASALGWVLFFIILVFTLLQFKNSKWVYYEADTK